METTGERWRLGHRPALDGLRGMAVLVVLAGHAHVPFVRPGVGVLAFFTLSGFLITTLLLEELDSDGRIDLLAFYWRRSLRLVPALLALIAVVALIGYTLRPGSWWTDSEKISAALLYFSNFLLMSGDGRGALAHTWSLAMEEQFYITWPVLLLALWKLGGRRAVIVGAATLALASQALTVALVGDVPAHRVTYGPDTGAVVMLLGCLLAAVMHRSADQRSRPDVAVLAISGLAVLTLTATALPLAWVPLLGGLLTLVIIAASTRGHGVRWLSTPPLLWVGRRSYGLYLWHYPVAVLVDATSPPHWGWNLAVTSAAALVLAAVSWRYVESPFLRMKGRVRRRQTSRPSGLPMPLVGSPFRPSGPPTSH